MSAGKAIRFGGEALLEGEHTYYTDQDGNEKRADFGAELPAEKVANAEYFVKSKKASIVNAARGDARTATPEKESAL